MTRDILVYALGCGCTDWCTCGQCGLTEPHTPGTRWECDEHGKTTVTQYIEVPEFKPPVDNGALVAIGTGDTFTLTDDHPMRSARCAVCSLPVNGEPVTLMSVAAIGGPGCDCGLVPGTTYIFHGTHLTMTPEQILTTLEIAMTCQNDHPWTE